MALQEPEAPAPEEPKYRHQFFQTQSVVEVAVLAKNLTADRLKVSIQDRKLTVIILDSQGQQASSPLPPLCCLFG